MPGGNAPGPDLPPESKSPRYGGNHEAIPPAVPLDQCDPDLIFLIFTMAAFVWATDLIEQIDPFKIYKPAAIGIGGGIFLGLILIAALFVYRPWCQFFCPFGLVGWLIEKVSLFRIVVNHETCIGCRSCEKACPSTVMGAILKRDRMIPDCFACGTCIEVCPTGSIRLAAGKRG